MNEEKIQQLRQMILEKCSHKKRNKLKAMEREGKDTHYYDDDIVETISDEFTDRISVLHLIGDIIRTFGGLLGRRQEIKAEKLEKVVLEKIIHDEKISRKDIAELTMVSKVSGNTIIPFMNGGPEGTNWNDAPDGFYDQIKKAKKFIIGVELGFKGDSYGYEVAEKLIAKKQESDIHISVLIDGFVSIFLQKPDRDDVFQKSTQDMIKKMKDVGINVKINDSWNPASSDFLAANHVKLWIFDGVAAFFGGIGIESQFKETLYDQMDLVRGPFVKILTLMAILLLVNQKKSMVDNSDGITQIHEMKEKIKDVFLPTVGKTNDVFFEIAMNVPGYIQDAQKKYIELLKHKNVREIYIMTPYFSDDKIARTLVKTCTRLSKRLTNEKISQLKQVHPDWDKQRLERNAKSELEKDKRIFMIFPKKQENAIIEEVSKYYAYYLRCNPIVETRQYVAKVGTKYYEMLHAKQMVVVLHDNSTKWTKYVKFGGSYNPAGRAHNMWELNATAYNFPFEKSDEPDSKDNPIKDYLDNVMKKVVDSYSEPFPWGQKKIKVSMLEKFVMKFAQILWF